jgi:hypothetical protein
MGWNVKVEGLDKALKKADEKILRKPMKNFFNRSAVQVQNLARIKVPVDTGRLRNSISYEIDSSSLPLWAKIGTNVRYGKPVEFGTGLLSEAPDSKRRRYFPPPAALDLWASRHGIQSGLVVALGIFKRGGTPPRPFLRPALEESINAIGGFLDGAASEIARAWGD